MAIVKFKPEDFVVKEVYIPKNIVSSDGEHAYYYLSKKGFTTFEAVERVCEAFGCDRREVSYAGLKDEDGITEQLIGVAKGYDVRAVALQLAEDGSDTCIELTKTKFSGPPIEIGQLIGNAFRVVVRNINPSLVESIERLRKCEFYFINYYDTQRFGIPGSPKNTHLVGKSLIDGEYGDAFKFLLSSGTREAKRADLWIGDERDFFASLDPRVCAFYYAAAASYEWNGHIVQAIDISDPCDKSEVVRDGIRYVFTSDPVTIFKVQAVVRDKPLVRYAREGGFEKIGTEERPAVIQTRFRLINFEADEYHSGMIKATYEYFLPSGCYATMAMDQFLQHVEGR